MRAEHEHRACSHSRTYLSLLWTIGKRHAHNNREGEKSILIHEIQRHKHDMHESVYSGETLCSACCGG